MHALHKNNCNGKVENSSGETIAILTIVCRLYRKHFCHNNQLNLKHNASTNLHKKNSLSSPQSNFDERKNFSLKWKWFCCSSVHFFASFQFPFETESGNSIMEFLLNRARHTASFALYTKGNQNCKTYCVIRTLGKRLFIITVQDFFQLKSNSWKIQEQKKFCKPFKMCKKATHSA